MTERLTLSLDEHAIVRHVPGTREALHAASTELYRQGWQLAQRRGPAAVDEDSGEITPRVYVMVLTEAEDERSIRQNKFYWGPVLGQIAEQGRKDGRAWDQEEWHNLFKRVVLGYEVITEKVAGRKRKTSYRRLRSTRRLSVRQMSRYLDEVIALATTELHVEFDLDQGERDACIPPKRQARKTQTKPATEREETTA
jgi:hypothetical protein